MLRGIPADDFHSIMDGATLLKCNQFEDALIQNM